MENQFLELIIEINISTIKLLVINKHTQDETKIVVLYKKIYHNKIIDSVNKRIINLKKIQEWLAITLNDAEQKLNCKLKNILVVVCDLGFKLLVIDKTYHFTTDKFDRKNNAILLERIKILNTIPTLAMINIIPLSYKIDNDLKIHYPPIGLAIKKLITIKALCYFLNKNFINDVKILFHQLDLNIKEIISESVGLSYEQSPIKELKQQILFCDVDHDYSKVAINYSEIIWNQAILKIGINQIIKDIDYFLNCGLAQSRAIFELYGILSINFEEDINNKIIFQRYFADIDKKVIYKVEFLTKVINARVLEIITKLVNRSRNLTNLDAALFIFSGQLSKIQNFKKFINYHFRDLKIKLYQPKTIGVTKNNFSAILGSVYYFNHKRLINQRLAKKIHYNQDNLWSKIKQLNS